MREFVGQRKNKWEVTVNDLNLLSIPVEKGLVISTTRPEYQAGFTPDQANLIAAAPHMYEALKELCANLSLNCASLRLGETFKAYKDSKVYAYKGSKKRREEMRNTKADKDFKSRIENVVEQANGGECSSLGAAEQILELAKDWLVESKQEYWGWEWGCDGWQD